MEKKARRVCLLTAVILCIFLAVFLSGRRKPAVPVHISTAVTQDIYNSVTVPGTVVPARTAALCAAENSVVTRVHVREGESVEAGQALCTLEKADAAAFSAADVQAVLAAVQEQADEMLTAEGNTLTAPFSGTVLRLPREGQTVREGVPCVLTADLSALRVRAETPELYADELVAGQKANVTLAASDEMYPASVVSLAPVAVQAVSLTGGTGSATVETLLSFSGSVPGLRPGSSATVKIFTDHRRNAVVVPYEAVCQRGEQEYVFTVENGRAVQRAVTTGYLLERLIEVREGLSGGEKIVLSPPDTLENGAEIEVTA